MESRLVVAVLALVITLLTLGSMAGHTPWDGSVLIGFTDTHGLNEGDLPVLGAWLVGMLACGWLWRRA